MNENMFDNEDVKKYLSTHQVPEIVEALYTAAAYYRPQHPLKDILLYLKRIKSGDFNDKALCWDSFINESDLPVERVFKPCFIEQHLCDNPFVLEKYHRQMIIAIEYHSKVQLKKFFSGLQQYHQYRLAKKRVEQRNNIVAYNHFGIKIKRRVFKSWVTRTKLYTANVKKAINILLKSLSYTYMSRCFIRWRLFTKDIHWKNNYFQKQALKQTMEANNNNGSVAGNLGLGDVDHVSRLPSSISTKIFKFCDMRSRIECSMVCHSWHALLQDCSLYTELDLSDCGFQITDVEFNSIMKRFRFFLYHLKLANCYKVSPKALSNLKECKNLQDIDVSGCQIKAPLLHELGVGCPFVTYLNLACTKVDDTCFANIAKHFPSLKYLDLSYCKALSEAGFYYLVTSRALKNLAHLNLSGCIKVNGNCLANIGQCCQLLTSFILDCIPNLSDDCMSKLGVTCPRLRILSLLQAVRITDKGLKFLSTNLTQLEKIYIEGNKYITDTGVAAIMSLRNLRHVHIVDCLRVYDKGLKPCQNLRILTIANFTDCIRITDGGMKNILDSPSASVLRELTLTNCIRVGDQTVQRLVSNCHNLTYLSIAYCENVTDVGIAMLAKHPNLSMLDISGCSISDYGAGTLKHSSSILSLSMAECNLLTDIGIERMSKLENLKYLDISYCTNISDYGMKMLIFEKKCLSYLNIAGCKLVSNSTLSSLASVCDYLVKLNISENKNITDKGIRFLRTGCKKLRYLNISYCNKLNYGSISKLIQHGCNVVHTMNVS